MTGPRLGSARLPYARECITALVPLCRQREPSNQVWGWSTEGVEPKHAEELNLDLDDKRLPSRLNSPKQLIGTPRHLSQHPGGFVLTQDRLDELVPIEPAAMEDRQVIEWDKDDIDALKFMKVDVLALGMLSCMKRGFDLLSQHKGIDLDLATIPAEDPRTYAMIRKADTLGTFQIETARRWRCCRGSSRGPSMIWSSRSRSSGRARSRATWSIPICAGARARKKVDYPKPELEKGARKDTGRAAVPGAGDAGGDRMRRLHAGRGRSAAPRHGDVQAYRRRLAFPATS